MSIKAIFPAGVTTLTVNGLHQWDYGQTLDIEAPDLPRLIEVHFACSGMDEAVVRLCEVIDGKTSATIPDVCLEQRSPVVAWVYEVSEAGGKTILTVTMPVIARIKPPAGASSPQVADQYAQLITLYNDQMDAIFSGASPVGRSFEADHATEADHAAMASEAAHAATADRAATADNAATADHAVRANIAAEANKAKAYDGTLPVSNGGTGLDSVPADHVLVGGTGDTLVTKSMAEVAALTGACRKVTGTAAGTGTKRLTIFFETLPTLVVLHAVGYLNDSGNITKHSSTCVLAPGAGLKASHLACVGAEVLTGAYISAMADTSLEIFMSFAHAGYCTPDSAISIGPDTQITYTYELIG
jgi:hypothetical protein